MEDVLSAMNCHYRFYDLRYFFETISRLGFKYCEIWTSPHHFYVDYSQNEDPQKLLELEREYGVKIICICPEQTNPKPNNIATQSVFLQKQVAAYFKRMIDLAQLTESKQVLVTSGWSFLNEDKKAAYERSVVMMTMLCDYAREKGVILALEALQPQESRLVTNSTMLKGYLKDVGAANLKVCIDMGAMAKAGETIDDYFNQVGKDISHVHFVDGKPTGHLAWGDGNRDMKADLLAFYQHDYRGFLSLETASERYFANPSAADEQSRQLYMKCKKEVGMKE